VGELDNQQTERRADALRFALALDAWAPQVGPRALGIRRYDVGAAIIAA
jgi:hypothetical protein